MNAIVSFFVRLWATLASLPRRAAERLPRRKPKLFHYVRVEDIPDRLIPANVYLAGEDNNLWAAAMLCPCGCKDVIELNLMTQARPCWKVQQHPDRTVSLAPSVWRQKGCGSHFFVRHGRIDWC